jgi:hypothetical protein
VVAVVINVVDVEDASDVVAWAEYGVVALVPGDCGAASCSCPAEPHAVTTKTSAAQVMITTPY